MQDVPLTAINCKSTVFLEQLIQVSSACPNFLKSYNIGGRFFQPVTHAVTKGCAHSIDIDCCNLKGFFGGH